MTVTAAEFQENFGKYLDLLSQGDILITQNGKTVAKLVRPISAVESLTGLLEGKVPKKFDERMLREERRRHYEVDD